MAEHVTSDQLIFFNIAAAMASIRFINVLEDKHIEVEPKFAEANTLTYGTRVDFENARVDLSLNVRKVFFSTYNKKELSDSFEKVSQIYPYLVKERKSMEDKFRKRKPRGSSWSNVIKCRKN